MSTDETLERMRELRAELDRLWPEYSGPPGIHRRAIAEQIRRVCDEISREVSEWEP